MKDYIHKHLEKRYPTYQHIIDMDVSPVDWIQDMFGLYYGDARSIWRNWCCIKYGNEYDCS